MAVTAIHLVIHGRVQHVGYRAWAAATARQHGLTGWVRNRRAGTVEAVFYGATEAVDAMVAACRRGPLAARVTHIDRTLPDSPPPADFQTLPTE